MDPAPSVRFRTVPHSSVRRGLFQALEARFLSNLRKPAPAGFRPFPLFPLG